MKLVNATDVIDLINGLESLPWEEEVEDLVNSLPSVNAVSVVKCKDCIHDGLTTCPLCYIEKQGLIFINHDPEFFCAFGGVVE